MSGVGEDRGLHAVARVREVRARDSRIGLQEAIGTHRRLQEHLDLVEVTLQDHHRAATTLSMDLSTFAARRSALGAQGAVVRELRVQAEAALLVREVAAEHWRADKTRQSAVEELIERRAAGRRAERARDQAKELDEVGTRVWLHRRRDGRGGGR